MPNPYGNKKWQEFREQVIDLDGNRCTKCHRKQSSEIILQVHHKKYQPRKLPWEYAYKDCETLCKGCHAQEHGLVMPRTGWEFLSQDDLGDLIGTCELCQTPIRHVFTIHHENWEPMDVGTICCDHLTGTTIATELHKYQNRLDRFLTSVRWKEINDYLQIKQAGIWIMIKQEKSKYRVYMNNKKGGVLYDSLDSAKKKAFESIENGKAQNYLDLN